MGGGGYVTVIWPGEEIHPLYWEIESQEDEGGWIFRVTKEDGEYEWTDPDVLHDGPIQMDYRIRGVWAEGNAPWSNVLTVMCQSSP